MALRARLDLAKLSQAGLGLPCAEVMISTVSPVLSVVLSGTATRFTRAPTQRCPMSVWMV